MSFSTVACAIGSLRITAVVCAIATLLLVASPARADDLDPGGGGAPEPTPIVVPPGLYLVTEVYAGDVVTASGSTTTYTTVTVQAAPGTYARVIDSVATGQASVYDGRAFNGRARLSDGRLVAGTYYETFVLTSVGFVSVSIVFFQSDSETRATPSVAPTAAPTAAPPAAPTAAPVGPLPVPTPAPTPAPTPIVLPPTPAPLVASAAVALGPSAPVLASIEILRGRTVHLYPRAFVDGAPVPVRSWRLVSGVVDVVSRAEGGAADACDAAWLQLPPAGTSWVLRFDVTSDAAPGRVLSAIISVAVRSPALRE